MRVGYRSAPNSTARKKSMAVVKEHAFCISRHVFLGKKMGERLQSNAGYNCALKISVLK